MDPAGGAAGQANVGGPSLCRRMPTLPFKLNQNRRHHIPKQKHKVTNSAAYDAALRQRGSLTVWFTDEAVAAWKAEPRTTPGGQPWYSPLAILTALTLRGKRQPIPALLFGAQVGLVCEGLRFHGSSACSAVLRWPFAMRSMTVAI